MTERAPLIVSGGAGGLAESLAEALGVAATVRPDVTAAVEETSGVVWVHLAPASRGAGDDTRLGELEALLSAERTARCGLASTFIAVVPIPGASPGSSCDLAVAGIESVMRTELGHWSQGGRRILGVTYAGIEGYEHPGQRPLEELRMRAPLRRLASVEGIADVLRFLASTRASYMTGAMVRMDGGAAAYSWVYPTRNI